MSETTSNHLTTVERRDITVRLRADVALRDLPIEEPFPPVHPGWKTCASFRHVNALAAGWGELWAVTWGGVVRWRFDNNRVTFTRFASEHGLPGIRFECIALDHLGHPWVGGAGVGLSTFDGNHWHTFTVDDGLPSNDVLCITNGADGRLWVGTRRGLGCVTHNGDVLHWQSQSLDAADLPADEIRALVVDEDGTLWLGTDWGLYQLGPDGVSRRYTTQHGLPCLQVTQLASDVRGRLWVGTAAGLCLLDGDHIVPRQDMDQPIWGLTVEPDGKLLWVVTPEGISAYTPEGLLQSVEPHPALGRDAQGRVVAVDETGRRWMGYSSGVTQQFPSRVLLSKDDVDQMTRGESSLCNCITAIEVDDAGRVWVGTPEGLWYLEHNVWRKCQSGIELEAPLVNVQAIAFSSEMQRLWVGGWREDGPRGNNGSGLRQFIGTTEVPLVGEMPELSYVDTLTCDVQGRVWVADEGIVHCFDGERWEQLPPLPGKAVSEVIQALAVGEQGILWCGTTGGLWHYNRGYHREDVDVPVQALACGGTEVWSGTSTGLKLLSGRQKRRWVDVKSLTTTSVTALATGQDGVVWVGTAEGLDKVTKNCQVFTARNSGLACKAVRALMLDDNTLWIGTANGLSCFKSMRNG